MNQFVVVRIRAVQQALAAVEILREFGGGVVEPRYQNSPAVTDFNTMQDPAAFYFANTDREAELLCCTLAKWNPGSTWQWFKVGGIVESRLPGDTPKVKKITEKGFLPQDIE